MASEDDVKREESVRAMKRWREEFAQRLNTARPDRYLIEERFVEGEELVSGQDYPAEWEDEDDPQSDDWIADVAAEMESSMPMTERQARMIFADKQGRELDGRALRQANDRIRRMYHDRQPDLGWFDAKDLPVSVEVREPVWGGENRVRIRTYRVRLAAMTDVDWDAVEIAERRRAAREFRSRNEKCDAAQMFSERQRAAKARNWLAWLEAELPEDSEEREA